MTSHGNLLCNPLLPIVFFVFRAQFIRHKQHNNTTTLATCLRMDGSWQRCWCIALSRFFGTCRDLCCFEATSKISRKLVAHAFEQLVVQQGLLLTSSPRAIAELWCRLLDPEALASVWAAGIEALAAPSSSRIERVLESEARSSTPPHSKDVEEDEFEEDFVLVPRRRQSTTALAGLDMGLQVRDCLSLDSAETKMRLERDSTAAAPWEVNDDAFFEEVRVGGVDYCYEYERGYGLSVPRRARPASEVSYSKGLRECNSCGLWYFSSSGESSECVRCRRNLIFLSPAREVLLNRAVTYRDLVETARKGSERFVEAFATISVDVPRTTSCDIMRTSLRNVLEAYAVFCPCVGYCQGMSHVAWRLLRRLGGDEERTFWSMVVLMDNYGLKAYYLPGLRRVQIACFQLGRLVEDLLPSLSDRLRNRLGGTVSLSSFSIRYFQTLLSETLPEETADAVFDAYLVVSEPSNSFAFLVRVILAVLSLLEPLLEEETEDPLRLLNCGRHDVFASPKLLLERAQTFSAVDRERLWTLERQFNQRDPRSSVDRRYSEEKKSLSPLHKRRGGLGKTLERAFRSFFATNETDKTPASSRLVVIDVVQSSTSAFLLGGLDDDDED